MKNKINIIGLCLILFVAMPVLFKQNTFAAKASKIDSKFTEPVTFSKKEYSLIKTKELKELTVYLFFQPKEDALKWSSYITKNQWKKNRRIFSDIVMPYYQSSKSSWLIKAWMGLWNGGIDRIISERFSTAWKKNVKESSKSSSRRREGSSPSLCSLQ